VIKKMNIDTCKVGVLQNIPPKRMNKGKKKVKIEPTLEK